MQKSSDSSDRKYLKLISFDEGKIHFHSEVARETFASTEYAGSQVSLVSVIGATRTGKSFLIGFLADEGSEEKLIMGRFKSGYERCTEGILIFFRPFIFVDKYGTRHAIFHLDTQGTFDLQSDRQISEWILTMNLLVSNVQIVNLKANLGGDDLRNLHRATEIAKSMTEYQIAKDLVFLIRDFPQPETSSRVFLEQLWQRLDNSKELSEIGKSLRACFPGDHLECFFSPLPSTSLMKADNMANISGEDVQLLECFEKIKSSIQQRITRSVDFFPNNRINYWLRVVDYLNNHVPRINISSQMTRESTMIEIFNKIYPEIGVLFSKTTLNDQKEIERKIRQYFMENQLDDVKLRSCVYEKVISQLKSENEEMIRQVELEENAKREQDRINQRIAEGRMRIHEIDSFEDAMEFQQEGNIKRIAENNSAIEATLENVLTLRIGHLLPEYFNRLVKNQDQSFRERLQNKNYSEPVDRNQLVLKLGEELETLEAELDSVRVYVTLPDQQKDQLIARARETFTKTLDNAIKFIERIQQNKAVQLKKRQEKETVEKILKGELLNEEIKKSKAKLTEKKQHKDEKSNKVQIKINGTNEERALLRTFSEKCIAIENLNEHGAENFDDCEDETTKVMNGIRSLTCSERNPMKDQKLEGRKDNPFYLNRDYFHRTPSIQPQITESHSQANHSAHPTSHSLDPTRDDESKKFPLISVRQSKLTQTPPGKNALQEPKIENSMSTAHDNLQMYNKPINRSNFAKNLDQSLGIGSDQIDFDGHTSLITHPRITKNHSNFQGQQNEFIAHQKEIAMNSPTVKHWHTHAIKNFEQRIREILRSVVAAQEKCQREILNFEAECLQSAEPFFIQMSLSEMNITKVKLSYLATTRKALYEEYVVDYEDKIGIKKLKGRKTLITPCVDYKKVEELCKESFFKMFNHYYEHRPFFWLKEAIRNIQSTFRDILYSRDKSKALNETIDCSILAFWQQMLLTRFPLKTLDYALDQYTYFTDCVFDPANSRKNAFINEFQILVVEKLPKIK